MSIEDKIVVAILSKHVEILSNTSLSQSECDINNIVLCCQILHYILAKIGVKFQIKLDPKHKHSYQTTSYVPDSLGNISFDSWPC